MKKILLIAVLLIGSKLVIAQNTSLNFVSSQNDSCGLYVTIYAKCNAYPPPCNIVSNTLHIARNTSVSFASVYAFQSAVGCYTPATSFAASLFPYAAGFQWTDAAIQFDCPSSNIPPCSDGGSYLNAGPGSSTYNCEGPLPSWQDHFTAGGGCMTVYWSPSLTTIPVSYQNVTISY